MSARARARLPPSDSTPLIGYYNIFIRICLCTYIYVYILNFSCCRMTRTKKRLTRPRTSLNRVLTRKLARFVSFG